MDIIERFASSGLAEECIDNFEDYKGIVQTLKCCVCLDILKNPMECSNCETLYCNNCWEIIKMAGKQCVSKCAANSQIKKANKFIRELLEKLTFKCSRCSKANIIYADYVKHIDICNIDPNAPSRDQLISVVIENENKIEELTKEIDKLVPTSNLKKDEIRSMLLTNKLSVTQKMELYNATIEGKISELAKLIEKDYPILEEVSAAGYFWTILHYAMHYGKMDIIMLLLRYLKEKNQLEPALSLESSDGRCPLICLLKSNILNKTLKGDILQSILSKYKITLTSKLKKEIKVNKLEDITKKYGYNL